MAFHHIRMATLQDAARILEIYNPYILNTCITFEHDPLTLPDFVKRMEDIIEIYPYIVYEVDGYIVGYAYTSCFNPRQAYAWDCSSSVYVDESYQDHGIGSTLYRTLFALCRSLGYRNIYAIVTKPNPISLAFHKSLGYKLEGEFDKAGFKFGQWLGISWLCKKIGDFSGPPKPIKKISEIDPSPYLNQYVIQPPQAPTPV